MRFRLLLITLTLVSLGAGWLSWMLYESAPGQAAVPPDFYPEHGRLPRVMLFLHPRCPCSRATVDELAELRPRLKGVALEIILTGPLQLAPPGLMARLRQRFPNAQVSPDYEGRRQDLYQVWTSGQLVGYDKDGQLGYRGGITASRGQHGPSLGKQHLLAWMDGQPALGAPVFGCPLVDPDEMCGQRNGLARRNQ